MILDFSSVNHVDVTSVQGLIDVRNQLDRYAAPETVEWHIACVTNRWTKRALAAAGFGYPTSKLIGPPGHWKPIFSVAEMGDSPTAAAEAAQTDVEKAMDRQSSRDATDTDVSADSIDNNNSKKQTGIVTARRVAVVAGLNRPFFHIDVTSAVQSAVANAELKAANGRSGDEIRRNQ